MSVFVQTVLAIITPLWLQSCDSWILYFVPHDNRFYDDRDAQYVTAVWTIVALLTLTCILMGIALFAKRLWNIGRYHL